MIKKIIPLIALSLYSCKKEDKKNNSLLNTNDNPNAPIKAYIQDLMYKYPNNWPKIFNALKEMQIAKLLPEDQQILIKHKSDIERDLTKSPELLDYFHKLTQTFSINTSKEPNTGNFNTEEAINKRKFYDLMSNITAEIFSFDNIPILLDLHALLVMFFQEKTEWGKFFSDNKSSFQKGGKDFDYDRFPQVFDKNKKKIIWENLIQILKIHVKEISNDPMVSLSGIEKDKFIYDSKENSFPLTSATEVSIIKICDMFGIKYDANFSKVESQCDEDEIKNFCIAFSTYAFKKFGCKFDSDKKLKCGNGCGLFSSHHPLCFLNHQVLGVVWAIINTTLKHINKIDPTTGVVLDLSGTFSCDISENDIRKAVRDSLFGGIGYYAPSSNITEWHTPFNISSEFKSMNGYATLDYRYIINFCFYQCFKAGTSDNDLLNIKHEAWESYNAPKKDDVKNPIFADNSKALETHKGNITDFALATFALLNAIGTPSGRNAGDYLFCRCDDSQRLIDCINLKENQSSKELSESISKYLNELKEEKWKEIREGNNKLKLYPEFSHKILEPLWKEFANKNADVTNKYKILDTHKYQEDNADKFFFQMLYRTYEALGTYCLLNGIYQTPISNWTIYSKN